MNDGVYRITVNVDEDTVTAVGLVKQGVFHGLGALLDVVVRRICFVVLMLSTALVTLTASAADHETIAFGGRTMLVHAPARLPPAGTRALVVVLHGGLGNASRIANGSAESALNLDALADRDGFVVAYLNGTPVTRDSSRDLFGWNAGSCCGQSAAKQIDDVAYLGGAIDTLVRRYDIDPKRVYATGHSNGAMMAQRMACETHRFAAIVAISGPLGVDTTRCAAAAGARILAIHGADDRNVPVAGGVGSKGLSGVAFRSEASARDVFTASGASYTLDVVPGADHFLGHIDAAVVKRDGLTIPEETVRFFALARDR